MPPRSLMQGVCVMKGYGGERGGKITIVIADEDALAREGLKSMLHLNEQFYVVAEAYEKEPLKAVVLQRRPNIVILESTLLTVLGFHVIAGLMEASPETKVILMGTATSPEVIIRALQLGVAGYIPKSASARQFEEACLQVARGESPILPDLAGDLLLYVLQQRTGSRHMSEDQMLTRRQYEVLGFMVQGYCNKEIAGVLSVSETTVKSHVTGILRKLGVTDRTQAVVKAIRDGLVTPIKADDRTG